MQHVGHPVAMCCDMKMVKFEQTTPNMSQQGGQTPAKCRSQQYCDMLR